MPEPRPMIDLDELNTKLQQYKEKYPDYFNNPKTNADLAADMILDEQEHPEFHFDDEISKRRLENLMAAKGYQMNQEKLKEQVEQVKKDSEELAENLTGMDINHDGKIGKKKIEVVDPEKKIETTEVQTEKVIEPQGEQKIEPQVEQKIAPQPKPKTDIEIYREKFQISAEENKKFLRERYAQTHRGFDEFKAMEEQLKTDQERYPDEYSTPEKAAARKEKFVRNFDDKICMVARDQIFHPDYYTDPAAAAEREFLIKSCTEANGGIHGPEEPEMQILKAHPFFSAEFNMNTTLTDAHASPDKRPNLTLEQYNEIGVLRDVNGDPFPSGKKPWEYDEMIQEKLSKGEPVYFTDKKGRVYSAQQEPGTANINFKPAENPKAKLVDPKLKQETIENLERIKKTLEEQGPGKNDSEAYNKFKGSLDKSIEKLKKTAFADNFKNELVEVTNDANEYIYEKTGQKMNTRRATRVEAAREVKAISEAVQKGKIYDKDKRVDADELRRQIAEKAVKSFAERYKDSEDITKKGISDDILENKEKFNEQVEKAMKDPGFIATFGDKNHPVDESFLQKSATADGSDIIKTVNQKNKELTEAQRQQIRAANAQKNKRINTAKKAPVTKEQHEALQKQVQKLRKEMEKGYQPGKDPTKDAFMKELKIADYRLRSGARYINYNKMTAMLGDCAEVVYGQSLKQGEKDWLKGSGTAMKLDDCIRTGTKIDDNVGTFGPQDMQRAIASKIVIDAAEKQLKSDDAKKRAAAAKCLDDPKEFNKAIKDLMDSKSFQDVMKEYKPEDLEKLIDKDASSVAKKVGEKELELKNKGLTKDQIKDREEKQKEKEQEKLKTDKQKELDEARQKGSASVMFR